jgi:ApbE superfamily uncharacterized protein (UPF0280 family)
LKIKAELLYTKRDYRNLVFPAGLDSYNVKIGESDLHISTSGVFADEAEEKLIRTREIIENYIASHLEFKEEMGPVEVAKDMDPLIKEMAEKSALCGVGPMATVAGAVAQNVGMDLLRYSPEVIVENGGDIFIKSREERISAVFA